MDAGLVTLHGILERAYEKSSAEATVRRVPGVIGVRNEIAVRAAQEVSQPVFQRLRKETARGVVPSSVPRRRFMKGGDLAEVLHPCFDGSRRQRRIRAGHHKRRERLGRFGPIDLEVARKFDFGQSTEAVV